MSGEWLSSEAARSIPHWTLKGLEAAFPFATHIQREGEPSIDAPSFSGDEEADFVASGDYIERLREYGDWAKQQPDKALLQLEEKQRREWLTSGAAIDPSTFFNWWRERKYEAKLLVGDGFGDALKTYWPDNLELRVKPPALYQQNRILSQLP